MRTYRVLRINNLYLLLQVLILCACAEARITHPHEKAELAFWPSWSGELGLPYITFLKSNNNNNLNSIQNSKYL